MSSWDRFHPWGPDDRGLVDTGTGGNPYDGEPDPDKPTRNEAKRDELEGETQLERDARQGRTNKAW